MRLDRIGFMLNKLVTDLRSKGAFVPISSDLTSSRLQYYYLMFGQDLSKLNRLIAGFDEKGIPVNTSYVDVEGGGTHYYPISIGQVALSIYHAWIDSGKKEKLKHFLQIADWFVDNRQEDIVGTYWLTEVPKPEYHVHDPWKSAFAQSRALSVLLRAWQETNNQSYLEVATGALTPFSLDIADGGVAIRRTNAEVFYEEYVADEPTRVLDGHFFSLFGLFDYIRAVDSNHPGQELAHQLFEDGVNGLVEALPKYDLGYWVRFNRCDIPGYPTFDPCTINYLQLVTVQLDVLFRITKQEVFRDYQAKFLGYLNWRNITRMYSNKFKALKDLNRI